MRNVGKGLCAVLLGVLAIPLNLQAQPQIFGGLAGAATGAADTGGSSFGWRPFLGVTGNYYHNLSELDPNSPGVVTTRDLWGAGLFGGVTGGKSWGRTSMGLSYRGLGRFTYRDGWQAIQNHVAAVGLTHRASPRLTFTNANLLGTSTGGLGFGAILGGIGGIAPLGGFNPLQGSLASGAVDNAVGNPNYNDLVDDEAFDTRVYFATSTGSASYQLTERASVSGGAAGFIARRDNGQFGVQGYSLRGGVNYALGSRSQIGAIYSFSDISYHQAFGGVKVQGAGLSYGRQISRTVNITLQGGAYNVLSNFVGVVPLDPVLAELLGQPTGLAIQKMNRWSYSALGSIQKRYERSALGLFARRFFFPGNGLVLASDRTTAALSYSIQTQERLFLGAAATYSHYRGVFQRDFSTSSYGTTGSANYRLVGNMYARLGVGFRIIDRQGPPPTISQITAFAGLVWSPGEMPLPF